MAKRKTSTTTSDASRRQVEDAATELLRRTALALSRDGWNPHHADRSVSGVLSRLAREAWPKDATSRDRAAARAFALLTERLRRRWPDITIDAWEGDVYREPEDVIASLACPEYPWPIPVPRSPQETTIEAYMVLQALNVAGIDASALEARARAALPKEWQASTLADIASDVRSRLGSAS